VGLADLPGEEQEPFDEIMPAACHTEQARELGHCDGQPGPGLETHENTVADQLDERAQPQDPGHQAKHGNR
jgi:hypothetical protein